MEWIRTKQIAQNTKSRQNLWQVQTHLTGALACAEAVKGKLAFGFYDLLQWPHDSNLTIYVLLSNIQQLPKRIPEVLYLQLDNCFQENKNKYLLGFLPTHTIHVQTLDVYLCTLLCKCCSMAFLVHLTDQGQLPSCWTHAQSRSSVFF